MLDWTMDVFAGGSKLITKRGGTVWHHIEIGVEIWEAGRFQQEMESARQREQLKREREFTREVEES